MAEVVFANGDGWNGVYVDGKLFYEGHDRAPSYIVDLMTKLDVAAKRKDIDLDWIDEAGAFPENLSDVTFCE